MSLTSHAARDALLFAGDALVLFLATFLNCLLVLEEELQSSSEASMITWQSILLKKLLLQTALGMAVWGRNGELLFEDQML